MLETYDTERAIEMRIPYHERDRDRSFFSADLIPPVEICYLYGPTQYLPMIASNHDQGTGMRNQIRSLYLLAMLRRNY